MDELNPGIIVNPMPCSTKLKGTLQHNTTL